MNSSVTVKPAYRCVNLFLWFQSRYEGSNCSVSQVAIPVVSIKNIKKTKTAILLPNALVIATTNDRVREISLLLTTIWWIKKKNTVFLHMWKSIQKTFFLFLVLQYVFVSFLSRDNTYKFLMSICPHLEVGKAFYLDPYRRVMLPCFLSCMYCSWSTGRHCEPKTLALN